MITFEAAGLRLPCTRSDGLLASSIIERAHENAKIRHFSLKRFHLNTLCCYFFSWNLSLNFHYDKVVVNNNIIGILLSFPSFLC